ncbi:hypothetical protein IDM40_23035 [Nocardiopsis sp. HNM0947]|uniref:Lipoprotein n=1 Tax=Nocardiopsis coralli TaxID=2772213 RepID=A0ABR9PCJ2_9ACTN|nr:hypothetical protein [Nocardiopsis coralli]MBE3001544.1 hypothetical protein [Nocardiopsis coralli]
MSAHHPRRTALRLAAVAAPATLLLTGCLSGQGHVGLHASGHFTAGQKFPTAQITWCGDAPPAQIDLVSDDHSWRLTATEEFTGGEVEVDLSAPGEAWEITDGDGRAAYRVVPASPETEYTLGVSTETVEAGDEPSHDVADLAFTTGALAAEDGVYASDGDEGRMVSAEEFPPEC